MRLHGLYHYAGFDGIFMGLPKHLKPDRQSSLQEWHRLVVISLQSYGCFEGLRTRSDKQAAVAKQRGEVYAICSFVNRDPLYCNRKLLPRWTEYDNFSVLSRSTSRVHPPETSGVIRIQYHFWSLYFIPGKENNILTSAVEHSK